MEEMEITMMRCFFVQGGYHFGVTRLTFQDIALMAAVLERGKL